MSKIDICNRALVAVGANVIASFDDDSAEAIVANQIYDARVKAMMELHDWSFGKTTADLGAPLASSQTATGYAYAYNLPAGYRKAVQLWKVSEDDPPIDYEIYGNELHTDEAQTVYLTYMRQVTEEMFTALFEYALEMRLAADFAAGLTDKADKADYYTREAERWLRVARNADSQASPPPRFKVGRLKGARL